MIIKGADGQQESVTSASQGNLNTVLGAAGTILGVMNGGASVLGYGGNGGQRPQYVTKDELNFVQQLQSKDVQLASKDAQLALKESESYTDKKLVEVYTELTRQTKELRSEVNENRRYQDGVNAQQAVFNATANGAVELLKSQVMQMSGVTKIVIPQSNVCQTGCSCCQG